MNSLLLQELGIINCAVLSYIDGNRFIVEHENRLLMHSLFSLVSMEGAEIDISDGPEFLVDFMIDARDFWQRGKDGTIVSGIWSEQCGSELLRLEASAILHKGIAYLIVSNIKDKYDSKQKTLQIARELLLSNEKIIEMHDQVQERVISLSKDNHGFGLDSEPIRKAIAHAEIGIAVFDHKFAAVEQNKVLYRMFGLSEKDLPLSPSDILLQLCRRQLPEFERLITTSDRFTGEIFALLPSDIGKWLQITICPVRGHEINEKFLIFLISDISRVKYLMQNNERLTFFDMLTDLPNRRCFMQTLERRVEESGMFYLLHLDIRHIKRVNEIHGHLAGDKLLVNITEKIASCLSPKEFFARISGNEFAIIFEGTSDEECNQFCSTIIACTDEPFCIEEGVSCRTGLSIGIASFPKDGTDASEIMKSSDQAGYFAKQEQGNGLCFFSVDMKDRSRKKIELEAAIREAIEFEQFELYLQPIYGLEKEEPVKAEVLIRWKRPGYGIVSPDKFIPLAEESGLIMQIGQWVIEKTLQILEKIQAVAPGLRISVNLSPVQIRDRNLLGFIRKAIERNKVDPRFLDLEITEGVLIEDYNKILYLLTEIRKYGVTVSIDDFGTGYSSLAYIQKFPIDYLKIDKTFISSLETSSGNQAIVEAVIAMARSLNLKVIAEGVEKMEQKQFLKAHNCYAAQGYLFSRPLPFEDFINLLTSETL